MMGADKPPSRKSHPSSSLCLYCDEERMGNHYLGTMPICEDCWEQLT